MKNTPDDTIYRTPNGTRVRIVADKEVNRGQISPSVYDLVVNNPMFTVASVKDGKRWYGYSRADLLTEAEWLKLKKK